MRGRSSVFESTFVILLVIQIGGVGVVAVVGRGLLLGGVRHQTDTPFVNRSLLRTAVVVRETGLVRNLIHIPLNGGEISIFNGLRGEWLVHVLRMSEVVLLLMMLEGHFVHLLLGYRPLQAVLQRGVHGCQCCVLLSPRGHVFRIFFYSILRCGTHYSFIIIKILHLG